jgi:hypothetical protein
VLNLKTAKALDLDVPTETLFACRRGDRMIRRREFISLLGGAASVWPRAAHAQQPVMPVMGWFHSASRDGSADQQRAFGQGLGAEAIIL